MTFDAYETSATAGEPLLLFDFAIGTRHWRYTSADRPITYLTHVFAPVAIDAGNIIQGQEIRQKTIIVTLPRDTAVVQALQNFPPSTDVLLTIFAQHYDDPDHEAIVAWIGRIKSQNQKGSLIQMAGEPAYTGIQTAGLRRRWQPNCPHVLYDQKAGSCTLNAATYQVNATLTGVSADTTEVSSAGFVPPTGLSFAGGYLEWDSGDGYFERRTINSVSLTTLTLNFGSPDLVNGLNVNAYPGCRHTTTDCLAFPVSGSPDGNMKNFGGAPYIPLKNPFNGNPVY